jgi:major intracellular serine protease
VEYPKGLRSLVRLEEEAPRLGLRWIGTLGEQLRQADVPNAMMADELPHRFAILEIIEGSEAIALRNLFRLECELTMCEDLAPFVAAEADYPLHYSISDKIGANYDLYAPSSQHRNYRRMLEVQKAHNKGVKGQGVTVVVVDSGVEKPNIATDFKDMFDFKNKGETDRNGHGTAMTSIIQDIAPDAAITSIRISDGFPGMWKVMEGVSAASFGHQADIINLSMGLSIAGSCPKCHMAAPGLSKILEFFLSDISQYEAGGNGPPLLVASTGNENQAEFTYPAKWDFMVAVGSINASKVRSRFSNYGDASHSAFLVMPGGDDDDQENPTEWVGKGDDGECLGTSPATAYASAMLALYYSDSDYRQSDRRQFLKEVLDQCDDTFSGYDADQHGEGFLPYVEKPQGK